MRSVRRSQLEAFGVTMIMMLMAGGPSLGAREDQSTPMNVDRILIVKSKRTMTLFNGDKVLKTYLVAPGGDPVGAKQKEGDHKTPEGFYTIDSRNARSRFHLGLHVSYPNEADRKRARRLGVSPGDAIMIHGLPKEFAYLGPLHRRVDWTDGCIAVTNSEIEEIWRLVKIGTPVEIRP
jgi:murein L,D-transpeptidase YafK